jgi:hypothetical protein
VKADDDARDGDVSEFWRIQLRKKSGGLAPAASLNVVLNIEN